LTLENLVGSLLAEEPPDVGEFQGLKSSGLERLTDAENGALSITSRFDLAYNAAHALCLAALRRKGFRPSKRFVVFQVLPDTLGLGPEVWRVLDKAHRVRNAGEYDGHFDVDERLLDDTLAACRRVAEKVRALPPIR
jgi:hypothetical protein